VTVCEWIDQHGAAWRAKHGAAYALLTKQHVRAQQQHERGLIDHSQVMAIVDAEVAYLTATGFGG
jgi:hypothetical protein